MTHDEVIAEIALRDLEKRERLNRAIHRTAYQYYLGGFLEGSVLGRITAFAGLSVPVLLFARLDIPVWGGGVFMWTIVSLAETIRQRQRFEAFLELTELENQKAMKRLQAVDVPPVPDA